MVWTLKCCWHVVRVISACAVMCCQVRKLMTVIDDSQQQQQQLRHQAGSSSSSSSSSDDRCTSLLLHYVLLIQILGSTIHHSTSQDSTESVQAAWRELAKPTAATLEHMMQVQLSSPSEADTQLVLSFGYPQQAVAWHVVTTMLWLPADGRGVKKMGALLRAALPAAVPSDQDATEAAAGAAEAAETAVWSYQSADAATMASLFSMCISAVKLLTQLTRDFSPYAAMQNEAQYPAGVLEHIQQSAAMIIRSSAFAGASQPDGTSEAAAAELVLHWAMLMLCCLQLGLTRAQDAAARALSSISGRGASTAAAAAECTLKQMVPAFGSLCQLEDSLQDLCWAFSRWVSEPASAAGGHQQPAATVALPQLQQCQQQLQHELLPAVAGVFENAGMKRSSSSSSSADASSATGGGNAAQATTHQQTADAAAAGDSGRRRLAHFFASVPAQWTFSRSADVNQWYVPDDAVGELLEPDLSESDATEQQQQTDQQHQPLRSMRDALPQLLGSGQLQSWLAAASSALPLRWCCNNPGCSNLGTAGSKARGSELRRVRGRQCSLCKRACYCSKVRPTLWFAKRQGRCALSPLRC
jgi:hypothetical protein